MTPEHFSLVETAPGIHACVAGASGAAVGNAAIIDSGDRTIVVDSFMTAAAARELRDVAETTSGRGVFLLINSHWHGDHTRGNHVFEDVGIVATPRTSELIAAAAPADMDAWAADIEASIATLTERLESEDAAARASAERQLGTLRHVREGMPGFRVALPDLHIDDRLVIEGQRRVEVLTYGGGHTDSDVFVWLPEDRVVIAGDIGWNGIHPRTNDGHPAEWAAIAERILALGPAKVVPGHGDPGDDGVLEAMVPYLRHVGELLATLRADDVESVPVPPGSEDWSAPERYRDGLRALLARRA